jgi:5-methylcytosine-specific restriction endonuclease McrA
MPRYRLTTHGLVPFDQPEHLRPHRRWRHSYGWAKLRDEVKRAQPWCSECGAEWDLEAHHVVRVEDGGAIWDVGNITVLCSSCHKTKRGAGQG